jgi:MoxR-like ATPase
VRDRVLAIREALGQVIRGKAEVIDQVLLGVFGGGHVLLEDVPGVGKTTLAKAIARAFGVAFARVQFTPDLLPADITGSLVLNPENGSFVFQKGPVFTNVLLADEINRASPRTQSALLEAMNEAQVTVDGVTHALAPPFFVLATQNPADYQGTYPLPEAQLDRFLLRISIGYPSADDELEILFARQTADPLADLQVVCGMDELVAIQGAVRKVEMKPLVGRYLLAIVQETRNHGDLDLGVSPRGALALFRTAQAHAFMDDRDYVSPRDVQAVAVPTLAHRIQLKQQARFGGTNTAQVVRRVLEAVPVPP